jgi:hypothetical protein
MKALESAREAPMGAPQQDGPGEIAPERGRDRTQSLPIIIGWREKVALPDWGIDSIKTKIDTGARTSAIHVADLEPLPGNRVRFNVIVAMDESNAATVSVPVEADIVRISRVRLSHGRRQQRPVVATRMRLGPVERMIELSLVCRKHMLCRMLLGRMALKGNFLIDPSKRSRRRRPERGSGSP